MSGAAAPVLVVGASAAGLSTVEALRRRGHTGPITLLGAERHPPYDRPPLSKQVLAGSWEPERTRLRTDEALAGLESELVLGDPAVRLDVAGRTVHTAAGRSLSAESIVVATGVTPRTLPGAAGISGVHLIRTLDDAAGLRAALSGGGRVVVVGEGVLGAETAATARSLGLSVTMVGPQPAPMALQVGAFVGERLRLLHERNGVELRLGTGVAGLESAGGRAVGVRLVDGEMLPADVVVVAIGSTPATDWLEGSGLDLDSGVLCDSRCRAAEGIYAAGDVARWWHADRGTHLRLENRTNATGQAAAVAANILGADTPYTPIPYFWTDQYDVRVQVHGVVPLDAVPEIIEGDPEQDRFILRYREDDRTVGVLGWRMPRQTRLLRTEIALSAAGPVADPAPSRA